MAPEGAGGGKLAEFVSHHILGDVNRHMFAAVVHGDGMADTIREARLQVLRIRFSPALFIS